MGNSENDKKFHELVNVRNSGDKLLHSVRKSMKEFEEKIPGDEKSKIEAACDDLEKVLKADDKDAMEEKTKVLEDIFATISQKHCEQQQNSETVSGATGKQKKDDNGDV